MTAEPGTINYSRAEFIRPRARVASRSARYIQGFVLFQIGCQLALLSGSIGPFRVIVRVASFGASLLLLVLLRGRGKQHPSVLPVRWVLGIIAISLVHPTTNIMAGIAHAMMYLAILAPLFWVPRLKLDLVILRRVILILWGFYTLSAAVGVLQVHFPGRFQPSLSAVLASMDPEYIADLSITTDSGERILRPMGLTDVPGGAATGGFYAVFLSLGFFMLERRVWMKVACMLSMIAGAMILYFSQIRSMLVMAAICAIIFTAIMVWKGRLARASMLVVILVIVAFGGFSWAASIGGVSVSSRVSTLIESRPTEVYYNSRGIFLEYTINELLPQYPIGAGLGRWGMMTSYFGKNADPSQKSIYAEIQWTGWLLDGGVPLILAYVVALVMAVGVAWKMVRNPPADDKDNRYIWGSLLLAYDVGAIALTFNYPIFMSQAGLEFWLLNAIIFTAANNSTFPVAATIKGIRR